MSRILDARPRRRCARRCRRLHLNAGHALAGITTDTRAVSPGQLFVALRGERFDGHDLLNRHYGREQLPLLFGRTATWDVQRSCLSRCGHSCRTRALGSYRRREWGETVVIVAGSNGKTTTKDLIRARCRGAIKVHATTGNLNNRIGVPLTLLAIRADCEIAVVEAGTNMPGEVAILRDIIEPDIRS